MTLDANKKLAREFFACFDTNNVAGALDMMTEDATWWIIGRRELLSTAGDHTKEEIARIFHIMAERLKNGLKMTVKNIIGEGDQIAIEMESYGELQNGRIYNNQYHVLMTMRDGKVAAVREYIDTQHVFATWFQS